MIPNSPCEEFNHQILFPGLLLGLADRIPILSALSSLPQGMGDCWALFLALGFALLQAADPPPLGWIGWPSIPPPPPWGRAPFPPGVGSLPGEAG